MRILTTGVILAAAMAVAVPAAAQGSGTSSSTKKPAATQAKPSVPKPPAPKPKIGFRGFFALDTQMMTASKSFDAITGSSTLIGYGGGGEVVNLWQHLFVRGSIAVASTSGERAIVLGSTVIPTGVGIDIGLRTVEIDGGWRFPIRKHPQFTPYAGGGVLFVNYSEDSQFSSSSSTDNVNESFTGYAVQGGLDLTLSRLIYAAVEAQYRLVPNALGDAGVSKSFGETDLGGFVFRVMIGVKLPGDKRTTPAKPKK
jgi:opacity protein-like surface antigen